MRANTLQKSTRMWGMRARNARRGFTLIELLVVIAITALLLSLVFKPIVDSFNLTSRAGTSIESQTAARETMREITSLLSNSVFVYDNAQSSLNLWFTNRGGAPIVYTTRFTMFEYVTPARQLDQSPTPMITDPTTGQQIYTSNLSAGQTGYATPLGPGRVLGRVFLGLIDNNSVADGHTPDTTRNPEDRMWNGMPRKLYGNFYEEPQRVSRAQENRYTLYKAEVLAYIPNPDPADPIKYIPNLKLFHTVDANGNVITGDVAAEERGTLQLHDPNFFYDTTLAGDGSARWAVPGWKPIVGDGMVHIFENWRAVSQSMMPYKKVDMIALDRDETTNGILYYDVNGVPTAANSGWPQPRPLATFAPNYVQNDPGVPTNLQNTAYEDPSSASALYNAKYTHWANPYHVLVYRGPDATADPLAQTMLDYYQYVPLTNGSFKIVHINIPRGMMPPNPNGLPDVGPTIDPVTGAFTNDPRNLQMAFTVDPERGLINFAFPASVLVHDANNMPLTSRYSPAEINAGRAGPYEKRYLDLKTLSTANWAGAQLNPAAAISPLALFNVPVDQTPHVHIVPGSERVFGPDQRPGPHYGWRIQYTRVSAMAGALGPNEYRILYEDAPNAKPAIDNDPADPRVRIGYIEFNSVADTDGQLNVQPDPTAPTPPYTTGPNSLPTFKVDPTTGAIDPTKPADPVEVSYSFQMNRTNDVVKIDYLTRELMNVSIQARLYDPSSTRPQLTDLTQKIKVRNLQH